MELVATLVLLFAFFKSVSSFDSRNVVFTIISQPEPYHASVAQRLRADIENQVTDLEGRTPTVHITHEDFPIAGAWTIVPLLRPLLDQHQGTDVRWVVFMEPHTAVRCKTLLQALAEADGHQDTQWLGYPLSDEEPTIIHHYHYLPDGELDEEGGFVYPNFASGFAMRIKLIDWLADEVLNGRRMLEGDFSIDPAYELALLILGNDTKNHGPLLTADHRFCIVARENCATYPRQFDTCGSAIPEESIYFAVKTWSGFHETRVPVVKKTWGKHTTHLLFYSDKDDPSLPALSTGIPNTKTGHCAKTMAILKHAVSAVENKPHIKWIFLADDDTILGVQRLCEVLSCYRGGEDDFTVLGERYGFGYHKNIGVKGFDYITGGGGTAFSVGAARVLSQCACADIASADDMVLGACARNMRVTLTHCPLFHQNRPHDYPSEALSRDGAVSFHRHSSPDPARVYATWFLHHDRALSKKTHRDEL